MNVSIQNINGSDPACSFWDQALDGINTIINLPEMPLWYIDGYGGWSTKGCVTMNNSTDTKVTCMCDHLTNFAILLVCQTSSFNDHNLR